MRVDAFARYHRQEKATSNIVIVNVNYARSAFLLPKRSFPYILFVVRVLRKNTQRISFVSDEKGFSFFEGLPSAENHATFTPFARQTKYATLRNVAILCSSIQL